MLGSSAFPALLPAFRREWQLSASEAGWISGLYYGGYVVAVPVLASMTDRVDARRVYLASMALGAIANLGFALTARGFWSAVAWQMLAGVALAGTYMPGLKALTDRLEGPGRSRALVAYTSGFSLGISASFLLAGEVGPAFGWRSVFLVASAASLVAASLFAALIGTAPNVARIEVRARRLLDFRPVFANRAAMAFVLAYGCHVWELFGMRTWVVAYLAFSVSLQPVSVALQPTWIATALTLLGVAFSIGGNELSLRHGRRRVVVILMLISAVAACCIGFLATLAFPAVAIATVIYGALVMADSGSLTAGVVEHAAPELRGATMAVHSAVGFLGAFLGPIVFGTVLDAFGRDSTRAWGASFATLGGAVAIGALALAWIRPVRAVPAISS